jgi:hypothetical protein
MPAWTPTDVKNWIVTRCMNDPAGHPSGLGLLIAPSDIQEGTTDWDAVCVAVEAMIQEGVVTATPKTAFSSGGGVAFWQPVKLTRKAFLKFKGAS